MPLFLLLCDDSHIWHALMVFPQQKKLVSLSVLRMSALKYKFSVLSSILEYPTLIYKCYFTNRKLVWLAKNLDIEIKLH